MTRVMIAFGALLLTAAVATAQAPMITMAQRTKTARQFDDALVYLNANLEYFPKSARTDSAIGQMKNAQGGKAGAVAALEKSAELDPNNAGTRAALESRTQ